MSLTRHLSQKDSPVTRHFDAITDERAARRFTKQVNDEAEAAARRRGGLVLVPGTTPTLPGSAFDFGVRLDAIGRPLAHRSHAPAVHHHLSRNSPASGQEGVPRDSN